MPTTNAPSASIELLSEDSSNEKTPYEYQTIIELANTYIDDSRRTILLHIFDMLYDVDITAPLSVICIAGGIIIGGTLLFS